MKETAWGTIIIGEKERKVSKCIIWGKRREVRNRMCLLGATLNVWCSMASAAVVGATYTSLVVDTCRKKN